MYFTETPQLQRIEQMMISIPHQIPRYSCFRCNGQNYHDRITVQLALHCKFDNGRYLGICPEMDRFHMIEPVESEEPVMSM